MVKRLMDLVMFLVFGLVIIVLIQNFDTLPKLWILIAGFSIGGFVGSEVAKIILKGFLKHHEELEDDFEEQHEFVHKLVKENAILSAKLAVSKIFGEIKDEANKMEKAEKTKKESPKKATAKRGRPRKK